MLSSVSEKVVKKLVYLQLI